MVEVVRGRGGRMGGMDETCGVYGDVCVRRCCSKTGVEEDRLHLI